MQQARSPDGRQRQAAVRALAASGHAPALPVMLERLNDWVDAIRHDAREAVENFLREEHVEAWIASLDAVAALTRARRADHAALLARIVDWLLAPAQFARIEERLDQVPREVARLMLHARLREPFAAPTRQRAWHDAFAAPDVLLAAGAAHALADQMAITHADDAATRRLLASLAQAAMGSRFAGIRIAGMRAALALPDCVAAERLHDLCFDTNGNVRALAIGALRVDTAAMQALQARALDALAPANPASGRATALESLCTMTAEIGLRRCEALRHDPAPAVRATALRRLLARADSAARDAIVLDALGDSSARVRRMAVVQVQRGASAPSADVLRAFAAARQASLADLCTVATRLPPWERFGFLASAVQMSFAAPTSPLLLHELGRWGDDMRHTYIAPTAAERDATRHAWAALRDALPRPLQDGLAFHLRYFGILDGR
ncbi:MAG: hypothetical protein ACJ8IK_28040 [Burkholderiaceae bacterium]